MWDSSVGNTHAQIVDLPNVRLFFAPASNPQVEKEVLTM